jgi:hypothetical protein
MNFEELVKLVVGNKHLRSRWDVVSYLIGYKKMIDETDWEHIEQMYVDGLIE